MQGNHYDMLLNALIAGSATTFFMSTILATVVFDSVGQNSTWTPQDIEMGMKVQATDQHIEVFMDAILNVHSSMDIVNITKLGEDGEEVEGTIVDLFPVGDPASGKGTIVMKVKSVSNSVMPNLRNLSQLLTPMAFVKEVTFNEFMKSVLKLGAFGIKTFQLVLCLQILTGLGLIGLGAGMIYLDLKSTPVESITDDDDEE